MARIDELGGRRIEQYRSPNIGGQMSRHRGVVLHIAQGSFRGTISWQLNPDQRYQDGTRVTTSSTWIVGKEPGEWAQMADSDRIAWTQQEGSREWLSIELAGWAPDKPTVWQVEAAAQLLAWSARTYGHPIAIADHPGELGLGHHSMDREWAPYGEEWGHEACPGSGVIGAKAAIVKRATQFEEDDDMAYTDWPAADRRALARDVVNEWAARRYPRADGKGEITAPDSAEWSRHHAGGAKVRTGAALAELGVLRGDVAGLRTLLEQLLVAPPVPLTPEQLATLTASVAAAAREPGERIEAALAAAGDALAAVDDEA